MAVDTVLPEEVLICNAMIAIKVRQKFSINVAAPRQLLLCTTAEKSQKKVEVSSESWTL
jgi:hypothetical protein